MSGSGIWGVEGEFGEAEDIGSSFSGLNIELPFSSKEE